MSQQQLNEKYITSAEICAYLEITKASVTRAKATKRLPEPMRLPGTTLCVWERSAIQSYLDAWKVILDKRRETA